MRAPNRPDKRGSVTVAWKARMRNGLRLGARMLSWNLPPEFDARHYARLNPDLAMLAPAQLAEHYATTGRAEGRVANSIVDRYDFARLALLRATPGRVLEIGPFFRPLLSGIKLADIMSTEELRVRAAGVVGGDPNGVQEINYVLDPSKPLHAQIDRRFKAVLSSHSIEHQPDLIAHLEDVATLLEPHGRFFLMIPDLRYCFDAFLPRSSHVAIAAAHEQRRTRHTLENVIAHRAFTTHNDPVLHWQGENGPRFVNTKARIESAVEEFTDADGGYIDVHAWQFTPDSFAGAAEFIGEVYGVPFRVERLYPSRRDSNEFWVVLRRVAD